MPLSQRMSITPGHNERSPLHLLRSFVGHHDLRVYLTERAWVDVGRGSLDAALQVTRVTADFEGCVGTIGQFCNFATDCQVLAGGEHRNDLPVNIVFYNVPALGGVNADVRELRPSDPVPFAIGDAVVVSARATLLAGVRIGNGAVVAAGAVVASEVAPFTTVGGVPAKPIRERFPTEVQQRIAAVRWWDFSLPYLSARLATLQDTAIDTTAVHEYRRPMPRLIVRRSDEGLLIKGFVAGGVEYPSSDLPGRVRDYLVQMNGPGPYYWLADMWAE